MDLTWTTATILVVILSYIFYWMHEKYYYWDKRGIPNLKGIPFVRMAMNLLVYRKSLNELILDLYNRLKGQRFGGYIQIATPSIVLRDPELIYKVMITDFSYFEDRNLPLEGSDLLTDTLISLTGNKWRHARHKLTPSFTSGKLKNMFDTIKECSEQAADYLGDKTLKDIESKDLLIKYVLSVVGNVAFGMKLDAYNPESQESTDFLKASTKVFNPSITTVIKILIATTSPKLRNALKFKVVDSELDDYFRKLVKSLIEFREKTETRRHDFLQLMLDEKEREKQLQTSSHSPNRKDENPTVLQEMEEPEDKHLIHHLHSTQSSINHDTTEIFTDDFIASQAFVFLSGGTENTAAVLGFVLFELASHQDYQRKVQEEIKEAVSHGFSYQSLSKMTYLDQFLYETFRLHPAATVMFRICTKNYKVPDSDFVIEKGTLIMIPAIGLHMDPQYFPDPEKFDPDRFQDMDAIQKGTFFSFGAGPRMCIAMRFAILEIKIFLVTLLSRYNVLPSKKTAVPLKLARNTITPRVEGGIWLRFEKRTS